MCQTQPSEGKALRWNLYYYIFTFCFTTPVTVLKHISLVGGDSLSNVHQLIIKSASVGNLLSYFNFYGSSFNGYHYVYSKTDDTEKLFGCYARSSVVLYVI